jgi:CheY-like chemotaxis protein
MSTILVVEDGTEYVSFFRLFLAEDASYVRAGSCAEAQGLLEREDVAVVVLDMRFDRTAPEDLVGDVDEVASTYFGGDLARAERYVQENQGTLILARLRQAGYDLPALFVTDMPARKLQNLRKLYGRVHAVPTFDAGAIRRELAVATGADT